MIHDGVELPRLVPVEKASEVLAVSVDEVSRLIAQHALQSMRLNGVVHVLTESIADRLGVQTLSRANQENE